MVIVDLDVVAFNPPASDGGSPITSYTASCVSTDGGTNHTKTGAASPLTVTSLTSFSYSDAPGVLYGPYLGDVAKALYASVASTPGL